MNTGLAAGAGALGASAAPASPLLESYHGTYQSMSPLPSPLLLAVNSGQQPPELMDVSPAGSDDERGLGGGGGSKVKRRARFTDPEDDAARLAKALRGDRHPPDTAPLIEILPGLTHEQMMELRQEYKRLVKTGPDKKGVNIAKHIRARLKDADPSLMIRPCYATALGRWESEAYWANFWYQGDKTRRELLIEALMGRTNREIREIKDGFSDKKYDNSLTRCMKTELKEDKFKRAVLLVLEEKRMENYDRHGRPMHIDRALVEDDAHALHRAVRADKGGESAMIAIVVQRSDPHLREVLKLYNVEYRSNFARDALKKSGNLVVSPPPPSSSCRPLFLSSDSSVAGRAAGPHPQRRHQQARPRRHAAPPRPDGLQAGPAAPRAAHLAPRALPLGPPPHDRRQAGLPRALRPQPARDAVRGRHRRQRVGTVLPGTVHHAHARRRQASRADRDPHVAVCY